MVDEGLILSRFVHYAALLFTFGVCFFPITPFQETIAREGLTIGTSPEAEFSLPASSALRANLLAAFTAASMAGSLSEA